MPHHLSPNALVILIHHLSITHSFSAQAVHLTHQKGLDRKTANFTKMLECSFHSQKQSICFIFGIGPSSPHSQMWRSIYIQFTQYSRLTFNVDLIKINFNEGPRRYRIAPRQTLVIALLLGPFPSHLGYKLLAFL